MLSEDLNVGCYNWLYNLHLSRKYVSHHYPTLLPPVMNLCPIHMCMFQVCERYNNHVDVYCGGCWLLVLQHNGRVGCRLELVGCRCCLHERFRYHALFSGRIVRMGLPQRYSCKLFVC